ncbi:MAG TPA: hypothetical protein DEB46_08895 [Myxococcales bacterium]|nr:hypothetical protein [Myxococcales bacterium]
MTDTLRSALPVLTAQASEQDQASSRKFTGPFHRGYLKLVRDAQSPEAPALVFIHGFIAGPMSRHQWIRQMKGTIGNRDAAIYLLNWNAGAFQDNDFKRYRKELRPQRLLNKIPLLARGGGPWGLSAAALAIAASLYNEMFGICVERSDDLALSVAHLQSQLERPVLLVGHSLGARVCLRACEEVARAGAAPFRGCYAMGPAVTRKEIDLPLVVQGASSAPVVYFSRADFILGAVYGARERVRELDLNRAALGFRPTKRVEGIAYRAATNRIGWSLGHLGYSKCATRLLRKAGILAHFDRQSIE